MQIGCGGVVIAFLFVFALLNDCAGMLGSDSGFLMFLFVAGAVFLLWVVVQFFNS